MLGSALTLDDLLSDQPVSFHEFASFLRGELNSRNAHYLDGSASSRYSLTRGRNERWRAHCPLFSVA